MGETFPNGEGGICAPLTVRIVLGAGSPSRLVRGALGDPCQDGGALAGASLTGLVQFAVKRGTGAYAHAHGSGLASFTEDAARTTLIGRIAC